LAYVVVTTDGSVLADKAAGTEMDEASAQARCDQANKDAEALAIKTRYEIREK
jgi:hypothetical protein